MKITDVRALRLGRQVEALDIGWFEEPVTPEDIDGHRAVKVATSIPIASGECGHRHKEDRYRPSRALGHLIHARTATCSAPGCEAQAQHSELDHTEPWPRGDTCECNLSPTCKAKERRSPPPSFRAYPKG